MTHSTFIFLAVPIIILLYSCPSLQEECDPHKNNPECDKYSQQDYPSPLKPNHTCTDYIRHDRIDESHALNIIKKGPEYEHQTVGWWKQIKYSYFFHVNGHNPGQQFALCAMPKNGVTRIKSLIMKINGIRGQVHFGARYPYIHKMNGDQRMHILNNTDIMRIKLVRNPYIRAISMYTDKILNNNYKKDGYYIGWHMKFKEIPSFDEWVNQLYENFKNQKYINDHFGTQYDHCWENIGLKFDYVLKIERLDSWYSCFVENFDLWRYVMRGWSDQDHCFFSSKDVPCNGPVQDEDGKLIFSEGQNDGVLEKHRHDSFSKLKEFYKNETTAVKITQIYFDDIVRYNYPFWTEYLVDQQ